MTKQPFRFTLFLSICLSILMTATVQAQTVDFPDPNLRDAIERTLGKASGDPITADEMATLTQLSARSANISNLTGLEGAINLTELDLGNNNITDISPLAGLTNLTWLGIRTNSISDLSPLVANTGLGSGDRVNVKRNFLNAASINTHIPDLQSRAVEVQFDDIVVQPEDIAQTVEIPDPNLRAVIENTRGKASGDTITVADMLTLTELFAFNANISDLTGLEAATNLTQLGLGDNNITDISAIAGLTNLTRLWLANNSISDISALAGLTNLTRLWFWENSISDISALAGLTNLIELRLEDNNITDISAIAGLTNLTEVGLYNNSITDISAVAGLTNLTALWLYDNSISDISAVAGLTNLTELRLEDNSISDISPLVANTGLGSGDWVNVSENPLNAAAVHIHIPTLQDRGVVIQFDNIVVQPGDIDQTVVDIPAPNLRAAIEKTLGKASGDTITVADMETLTRLFARNANINDLTGLEAATNLTTLSLGNNNITDISAVAGLTNLTFLWIEGNNITDISPLAGLTNLTVLGLWENSISDISPLAGLTQLTELGLWENSISDISPLVANTGLGNGDRVNVKGNPLNAASINTHISALQNREVDVQFDGVVVQPEDIAQTVEIPDPNLRAAIENSLDKASGATITVADMETLTRLFAPNANISDLTGLEGASNLTSLTLWINSITDISVLAGLTNLTTLSLDDNNITDISPLVENTGLGSGDYWVSVDVSGNFLNAVSINTHIPALQSRGVAIQFDDIVVRPEDIAQTVDIPDPNLRAVIENLRGKTSGATITVADMLTLTRLSARNANISDLTGLESAINLTTLHLGTEYVETEELYINSNSISDLSPLAGLTNLTVLWLEGNNITDISPLAGLTNLTRLGLDNNSISDLSPLVANTGLGRGDRVNARGNFLNSLSIDTHIPALQSRGVRVEFDSIVVQSEDIAQTVDIPDPNLRAVIENARGKTSGDTITVADMLTLTRLSARNANISDLTGLESATNLTTLHLGTEYVETEGRSINSNSVSDLSPLAGLTNLTSLYLRDNSISDISALAGLTNLTVLRLEGNNITDISAIAGLTNLTGLGLWENSITDISAIAGLTNLTGLGLTDNNITDISPVAGLTNLTFLGLIGNNITDISAIAGLINLTRLWLGGNNITDISAIAGLTNLTVLRLEDNNISDLSPLVANTRLGRGDQVDVSENPLSYGSIHAHIPIIQSRGVEIQFDDSAVRTADVNSDGTVNILDLVLVASELGNEGKNLAADVSGDGIVNILDLVLVAGMFGDAAAAPSAHPQVLESLTATEVRQWLTQAQQLDLTDATFQRGIRFLEQLLAALTPNETLLLPNYPNPFNPETWIPYRLAEPADVTLMLYALDGTVVRTLALGHQDVGMYQSQSRAAYWDGRNAVGESVASGIYFYTLRAGEFTATRKMLILK